MGLAGQTAHRRLAMPPRVSVILTVFNRLMFFAEALGSVEAQTLQDYEIIIADDSGTGAARALSLASNNPRVHYRENTASCGVA